MRNRLTKIFLTAVVTLGFGQANAQGWHLLNIPIVEQNYWIRSVLFTSSDTGFIAGRENTFVLTKDRGKTWEHVQTGLKCDECFKDYSGLEYLGKKLYVSVRYGGLVNANFRISSENGGLTWDSIATETKSQPITSQPLRSQITRRIGDSLWVIVTSESENQVRYTLNAHVSTDRGATWVQRPIASHTSGYQGQPAVDALRAFAAFNDSVFFVIAGDVVLGSRLHLTSDRGHSWIESKDSEFFHDIYKIEPDRLFGVAGGYKYEISSDHGGTWQKIETAAFPSFSIKDVASHRSGLVYAYSDVDSLQGLLFESRDYANNWIRLRITTAGFSESPLIIDSSLAFIFAVDGVYTNMPESASVTPIRSATTIDVVDGVINIPTNVKSTLTVFDYVGRQYTLNADRGDLTRFTLDLPHGVYFIPELGKFSW
jgi:photosystem II stability/assembly factor-like uncharacterized protein